MAPQIFLSCAGDVLGGVVRGLYQLEKELGYELVLIGEPKNSEAGLENISNILQCVGITFRSLESFDELKRYEMHAELGESFLLSTAESDKQYAEALGVPIIKLTSWSEVVSYLANKDRIVTLKRETKETKIAISLNLDGSGEGKFSTGVGFFDHMLEQIARHGGIDLTITCDGDLHVDEHHTIEDVGILFGETLKKALGDKRGIDRYGFTLPMDETRAEVLIDFSGRPYFVWEVDFKREMVGEMPTEMFSHFFRSLADASDTTLHIRATGENDHHIIEGVFKAFARALKQAVRREENATGIPSTKGVL